MYHSSDANRLIDKELKLIGRSGAEVDLDVIEEAEQRWSNSYVDTSMVKLRRVVCDSCSIWGRMRLRKVLHAYLAASAYKDHHFYHYQCLIAVSSSTP